MSLSTSTSNLFLRSRPKDYRPLILWQKRSLGAITEPTADHWEFRCRFALVMNSVAMLHDHNPVAERVIRRVVEQLEAPYWLPKHGHGDEGVALAILNDHCGEGASIGITAGVNGIFLEVCEDGGANSSNEQEIGVNNG